MISGLSKLKWVVLFLLMPMASIAANSNGFVLQLKGPEVHTPSSPGRYGPVVRADTLWSVATATRPNNRLSLYKTMAAILALNPHAFLNGDINKMIDGSILKIPSVAEIQATDGSRLKRQLTKKSDSKAKSTAASKPATSNSKAIPKNEHGRDKLALLQGELSESNEHLLLSSETNRRLKLQLESIRMELAELKEQMAIDNQLKADLKALIEQQNAQISEQQATLEEAKQQAALEAESQNNWWLIGGVSGVFSLLSLIWLALWLKNRNDQKHNIEDNVMFDTDNTVDELSDYLNADNYSTDSAVDSAMPEESRVAEDKPNNEINTLAEPNFNLQMQQETTSFTDAHDNSPVEPIVTQATAPIVAGVIEQTPVMPELNLNDNDFSDIDLTLDDESTSFENDSVTPDLSWREELDEPSLIPEQPTTKPPTLDEDLAEVDSMLEQFKLSKAQVPESPSVVNDEFVNMDDIESILAEAELEAAIQAETKDVSYNEPQVPAQNEAVAMDDIDSLLADAGLDAIAQSNAESVSANLDNQQTVDMDDIDSLLAETRFDTNIAPPTDTELSSNDNNLDVDDVDSILASAGVDEPAQDIAAYNDELPQAHGQTVDEMLAELDGTANKAPEVTKPPASSDEPLNDIDAMLAEYSPNAFSDAPSDQAPIDVAAAQAEEFIDIDKLLNEASQQPASIVDEPYDQVKLDVGLDEYSNTLLDSNAVVIDDESNRFSAQLDLARAYLEIEDKDGAKSILEPLAGAGDAVQQAEVNKLLSRL
ncbi:FimV/HubP family polar landmark protein [Moritella sp.]|uniref:FimV/HubP family polar landmark protein n=1 Tax=Moritella sp. TaxID=78556 RepID=UPI001DB576D0|nr:FimV/HubP family polar landmark protein [Moritella sp.]MCJ8350338.1 hypothetical protein [Moritella sp.]NQZ40033.1 hypothetical protein [Moritella sp.]